MLIKPGLFHEAQQASSARLRQMDSRTRGQAGDDPSAEGLLPGEDRIEEAFEHIVDELPDQDHLVEQVGEASLNAHDSILSTIELRMSAVLEEFRPPGGASSDLLRTTGTLSRGLFLDFLSGVLENNLRSGIYGRLLGYLKREMAALGAFVAIAERAGECLYLAIVMDLTDRLLAELSRMEGDLASLSRLTGDLRRAADELAAVDAALSGAGEEADSRRFVLAADEVYEARRRIEIMTQAYERTGEPHVELLYEADAHLERAIALLPCSGTVALEIFARLQTAYGLLQGVGAQIERLPRMLKGLARSYGKVLLYAALLRGLRGRLFGGVKIDVTSVFATQARALARALEEREDELRRWAKRRHTRAENLEKCAKERLRLLYLKAELEILIAYFDGLAGREGGDVEGLMACLDHPFLTGSRTEDLSLVENHLTFLSGTTIDSSRRQTAAGIAATADDKINDIRQNVRTLSNCLSAHRPQSDCASRVAFAVREILSLAGLPDPLLLVASGQVAFALLEKARLKSRADRVGGESSDLPALPATVETDKASVDSPVDPSRTTRPYHRETADPVVTKDAHFDQASDILAYELFTHPIEQAIADSHEHDYFNFTIGRRVMTRRVR